MNGQRADIENALKVPERFPGAARVRALPDAAARGARPERIGLRRIANESRDAPADIRRADAFPLRGSRSRRESALNPIALAHERLDPRFAQRPRGARLEPGAAPLMITRHGAELCFEVLLARAGDDGALAWPDLREEAPRFVRWVLLVAGFLDLAMDVSSWS